MSGKREQLNFLIVGTQRTGSSALGEALGKHPDIVCGWEWTQYLAPWRKLRVAERALAGDFSALGRRHRQHMESMHAREKAVCGFRRLFRSSGRWIGHPRSAPALWIDQLERHLRWLEVNPAIRVIHIVRRDNLAWLRSKALSAATGQYIGAAYSRSVRERIPVAHAIRCVQSKAWVDERLASLQKTNRYLRLHHEDFLADNPLYARVAVEFLGCDPAGLPQLRMKTRPQSGADTVSQIENHEQLREALAGRGLLEAAL